MKRAKAKQGVPQITHFDPEDVPKRTGGSSLIDELRGVQPTRTGFDGWIAQVPEDLVAQLQEIAREYNAGTIRCSQRIIMDRFFALCRKRGVEINVGYNGFRGVFSQMRGKS